MTRTDALQTLIARSFEGRANEELTCEAFSDDKYLRELIAMVRDAFDYAGLTDDGEPDLHIPDHMKVAAFDHFYKQQIRYRAGCVKEDRVDELLQAWAEDARDERRAA